MTKPANSTPKQSAPKTVNSKTVKSKTGKPKTVKTWPTLAHDRLAGWPDQPVAGVDEVGRGPLAGEVMAAAVILPNDERAWFAQLNDSKKLSVKRREALCDIIMSECIWGLGKATLEEIADLNILWASMLAMERAVHALNPKPRHVLVDGNRAPKQLNLPTTCIIKGDTKSLAIAAASVIAKVSRDRYMVELDRAYPVYGWASNKGYPSQFHRDALAKHGPSPLHRRKFKLGQPGLA